MGCPLPLPPLPFPLAKVQPSGVVITESIGRPLRSTRAEFFEFLRELRFFLQTI